MTPVSPIPSATVVLVRDGADGAEVLLVQRAGTLDFHGGAWVFPGGRIDAGDVADGPLGAARRAAVRELREETGLELAAGDLVALSRWTTPELRPKRFETWFFVARAPGGAVRVDGGEIQAHRWSTARAALAEHAAGGLVLPPPTFVTLTRLRAFGDAGGMLSNVGAHAPEIFEPRPIPIDGGFCSLYRPDAGFDAANLEAPGPRHRLWVRPGGWRYERDFADSRNDCAETDHDDR